MNIHRFLIFFVCLHFCFCCMGCDKIYGLLDKKGAEEKKIVGEVIPFEKNPTIEEIQTLLYLYGYNPGKIDGILGGGTRNAISKFQKDNNLELTHYVDQATWGKLRYLKDKELVENNQLNIILIQKILRKAGFDSGKIDGRLGGQTTQAIKAFQKAHGLKLDGKIGYKTLSKMSEYLDGPENKQGGND